MKVAYKAMRILLYLSMAASGFLNLLTAAGIFLRYQMLVGFAWVIVISVIVGFGLIIWMCARRRWMLAGFAGLLCSAAVFIGYAVQVGKLNPMFYRGNLHIVLVPLFAFLTALFYGKLHKSRRKQEAERPLRKDESILG